MILRKSQQDGKVFGMSTSQDRVRDVIESSGLSQGAFAQVIGLDDAKMSKSLGGARRFSSLEYAQIAEKGSVSVDWLLTGREAPLAMAARAASGTSARSAVDVATAIMELRETADALGYTQKPVFVKPPPTQLSPSVQGSQMAASALSVCSQSDSSSLMADMAHVIEGAFGIDVAIKDLGKNFDGLAASTDEGALIVVSPSARPARQRFTMAHELGHLLSGDDQGVHPDADIDRAADAKDPSEVRANFFAASFLMPEEFLRKHVVRGFNEDAFCDLAVELLASPVALALRLKKLNLIDAVAADQWKGLSLVEAARRIGRVDEVAASTTRSQLVRPPGLLSRDLFAAHVAGKTTLRPYAQLLGTDTDALRAELALSEIEV